MLTFQRKMKIKSVSKINFSYERIPYALLPVPNSWDEIRKFSFHICPCQNTKFILVRTGPRKKKHIKSVFKNQSIQILVAKIHHQMVSKTKVLFQSMKIEKASKCYENRTRFFRVFVGQSPAGTQRFNSIERFCVTNQRTISFCPRD